jgi:hypothetical protein
MTIGAWILVIILGIIGIGFAIFYFLDDEKTHGLVAILITIIVIGGLILGLSWFYNNTGSGLRAMKDQQSNLNNGINRDIKVVESNGFVSYEFSGKADLETHDDYIVFESEGKRTIIYKSYTSTIVITEID